MQDFKVNHNTKFLLIIVGAFVLLTLSLVNIKNYTSTKKVLGIETQDNVSEKFWNDFLINNPNYIPGWIEIEKEDQAFALDPNFQPDSNN